MEDSKEREESEKCEEENEPNAGFDDQRAFSDYDSESDEEKKSSPVKNQFDAPANQQSGHAYDSEFKVPEVIIAS